MKSLIHTDNTLARDETHNTNISRTEEPKPLSITVADDENVQTL